MEFHADYYKLVLLDELERLMPRGSFVSYVWLTLGRRMHDWVDDWSVEEGAGFFDFYPVYKMFLMISTSKDQMLVRPEWLSEDDHYYDDSGKEVPPAVERTYSGPEQLAAYGRWLINAAFEAPPQTPVKRITRDKWFRALAQQHQVECLLLAYEALSYSLRMKLGAGLSEEEVKTALRLKLSELGKSGADKRHAAMQSLKEWTLQRYQEGKWPSANRAAHALKDITIEYGKAIGAHLSEENAQRTIAAWIRKSV
ncbi:hypothetical protein C8R21_12224 [Nitrosospira multiformis]|uniref:Uncharacterized protein n=1 Tax=Nitrosospira multiformis TaxID=1231 RepID=A0A2T5I7L5_9PROT|nr:hypothetical protein [Nitrosospira multiformis]PTQ79820.1 hypothetical protein C8R21_12224 [Nitrosospira multiformis]